jgi:hypothetical protein
MIAPLLIHVNLSKPFFWETDTSEFGIGAMLSQLRKNKFLHPVCFRFHKFSPTKINYKIYNKKILAVVDAFEK